MRGLHLTADLHGCSATAPMTDPAALRDLCLRAVERCGLVAVGELFHGFAPPHIDGDGHEPAGVTGVVLLAESHLAVHTWPELGCVTIDAYVCNVGGDNSPRAQRLMDLLVDAFAPVRTERHALERGQLARSALAAARPAVSPSEKASSNTE